MLEDIREHETDRTQYTGTAQKVRLLSGLEDACIKWDDRQFSAL